MSSATASDLPVQGAEPVAPDVPFSWTGFYAGVNAGYGWNGASKIKDPTYYDDGDVGTYANGWFSSQRRSARGSFTAGVQAGYNQQFGPFVLGIEADFNYLGQKSKYLAADNADIYPNPPIEGQDYNYHLREHFSSESKTEWFGTIRPRVGFTPTDRLLVYATAGLAYGEVKSSGNYNWHEYGYWWCTPVCGQNGDFDRSGGFSGSTNAVRWGWTAGGGVEYAITDHLAIKAEYLYVDLGKKNHVVVSATDPREFMTWKDASRAHIVRIGLNYRF
ncbi:outer membrane protein [Labrys monachus]|uniref:Outer membrane immunogenic protein n=1 Tax=Labrys monachus TaxID=217067 RepID=A0ABU0FH05_9HYPH|nr:outer membrane protein [Labrys monachus]MDQ0393894.1 outer membrane immunogenic protein [Labrys monachus]